MKSNVFNFHTQQFTMAKTTKTKRNIIYKMMLNKVLDNSFYKMNGYVGYGFCALLCCVLDETETNGVYFRDMKELYNYRPIVYYNFWFPLNKEGWDKRIKILEKCIEETSSKPSFITWIKKLFKL